MRAHSAGTVDSKQARQQSYFSNLLRTLLIDRIFVFPRYFIRPVHICMTNNGVRNVQCTADMSIIIISLWRYGKKSKTRLCLPR